MLFLGIDLAWGTKNTSGAAALCWHQSGPATLVNLKDSLGDDNSLLAWIDSCENTHGSGGLVIGVDAPLLVPNITGKRPCETELGRRFAKYQAGAHPANRTLFKDEVRGETLVHLLAARNIAHDPFINEPRACDIRQVMEVFPHPAHILLFNLTRTLKYKARPGRTYEMRWLVFAEYIRLLRTLAEANPPMALPADWPPADVTGLRGGALKRFEDGLDALTCAYIVFYYWWHGPSGGEVIGDMTDGYIALPRLPAAARM